MVILTDDQTNPRMKPTTANIVSKPNAFNVDLRSLIQSRNKRCSGLRLVLAPTMLCSSTVRSLRVESQREIDCSSDSGHGGQTKDHDGDEGDGYDEVIYPVDFEQNGHIVDDV